MADSTPAHSQPARRSRSGELQKVLTQVVSPPRPRRKFRKISKQDRQWLAEFEKLGFTQPELTAAKAGFKTTRRSHQLELRPEDLIAARQVKARLIAQMELDEALMLAAEGARDTRDRKVQATFLQMILRVHGALSDKPPSTTDRRTLAKQVAEIVERIRSRSGPSTSIRLRAAMESASGRTGIDLTVSPDPDPSDPGPDSSESLSLPPSSLPSSPPLTGPADSD